ncbi:hypothetical protein ACHAWU_006637 [Discostella pseudostelligera]|uniref:Uncharacterized protein n=1 Tax=Discostella pseudostelligera TaxID=259834 RepID=A0ABD3M064_9STRA
MAMGNEGVAHSSLFGVIGWGTRNSKQSNIIVRLTRHERIIVTTPLVNSISLFAWVQWSNISPLIFHTNRGPIKFILGEPDERSDCVIIMVNTTMLDWKLTLERWIGNPFKFCRLTRVVVVGFSEVDFGDRAVANAAAVALVVFHQKYNMPFYAVSDWTRSNLQKPLLELARMFLKDDQLMFIESTASLKCVDARVDADNNNAEIIELSDDSDGEKEEEEEKEKEEAGGSDDDDKDGSSSSTQRAIDTTPANDVDEATTADVNDIPMDITINTLEDLFKTLVVANNNHLEKVVAANNAHLERVVAANNDLLNKMNAVFTTALRANSGGFSAASATADDIVAVKDVDSALG